MIFEQLGFEHPTVWLAAIPWFVFWLWFGRRQKQAREWIAERVSPRFQPTLTAYTRRSLKIHLGLLLLMGLLLIAASAEPVRYGEGEVLSNSGRILLLFDASASMYAQDVTPWEVKNRFVVAQKIAAELIDRLSGFEFALASFSGVATFHLPMTSDADVLKEALRTIEPHTFYQNTGSSFTVALDAALGLASQADEDFQIVLLSDGEQPFPEAFEEPLAALASLEIPVHGLTIGSTKGQNRLIYDFHDVVAKKPTEERRVLREYTTRRVDQHLERMAQRTGGRFLIATPTAINLLSDTLSRRPQKLRSDRAVIDLSHIPLGIFLLVFLLDQLFFAQRRRPDYTFDIERLGGHRAPRSTLISGSLMVVLSLILSCGDQQDPTQLAHRANESGIDRDQSGLHQAAQRHYRRSLGFQITPHIPAYNLARSATLEGDFTTAHQLYQDALQLDPHLAEAYYNDGIVLFRWGRAERDPRDCDLARSLDFWNQSHRRFETALGQADPGSDLENRTRANLAAVADGIRELEGLIANPPPVCRAQSPQSDESQQESSGGGGGGGSGGGSDGGANDGNGGENENDSPSGNGGGASGGGGEDPSAQDPDSPPENESGGGVPSTEAPQTGAPQSDPLSQEPPAQEPPPGGEQPTGAPPPPPTGQTADGEPSTDPGSAADSELSEGEQEEVRQALERLEEQRQEEGKFHRRTLPEQFAEETWQNPDPEIWW